jgi:hypothetical protein
VKLLLDECVTRTLKRDLARHEVHTIEDAGLKRSQRSRRQHKAWGGAQRNPRNESQKTVEPANAGDSVKITACCKSQHHYQSNRALPPAFAGS